MQPASDQPVPERCVKDRKYRTFTYQQVDRVPDVEFSFWPQAIRRWKEEGMDIELPEEPNDPVLFQRVDEFFGFDEHNVHGINLRIDMQPSYEEKILEHRGDIYLKQGADGQIAECYLDDTDNSSIPHYISFPVKGTADWTEMKARYRLDDPSRLITEEETRKAREEAAAGTCITVHARGPYGCLREWMGFENLSIAFYEQPAMVHDMVEHWTGLCLQQLQSLPGDIPIDQFNWWEDMAGKNGPFVGPDMFREFMQPCYRELMTEACKRGCRVSEVDCDGNPHDIVGNWLEENVNVVYPLEIASGVDPVAWRKEFGKELRMMGGIDKKAVMLGGDAIDREFDNLRALFEEGGFIPHLDHFASPDISFANFCDYLEKKRAFIGK